MNIQIIGTIKDPQKCYHSKPNYTRFSSAQAQSGDLNSKRVWYSNGPKQLAPGMVCYLGHGLNNKLIVCYSGHRLFD